MLIRGRSAIGVEGSSESLRLSTRIVISTASTAVSIWRRLALYSATVNAKVLARVVGPASTLIFPSAVARGQSCLLCTPPYRGTEVGHENAPICNQIADGL